MSAPTIADEHAARIALAFTLAGPATSQTCDVGGCPAPALRRVDLFKQDFYFCGHHWYGQARRLLAPLTVTPADEEAPPPVDRAGQLAHA